MSYGNAHVVTGLASIVNPENIRRDVDLKELERQMIVGGVISKQTRDPRDRFAEELSAAADKLGISFGEVAREKERSIEIDGNARARLTRVQEPPPSDDEDDIEEPAEYPQERPPERTDTRNFGCYTREQERREQINSVMRGGYDRGFSMEGEKREDSKHIMLAEIDTLIVDLTRSGINVSRIPSVTKDSTYEEVESAYKMLRHKDDQANYCSIANEIIIFGAHALGDIFDGKKTWFGRYRPDLTGWHNHVNVKLARMRHNTSAIVRDFTHDYNIGPIARIFLELIPSMFLYSRSRSAQYAQPSLFTDENMRESMHNIRNMTSGNEN